MEVLIMRGIYKIENKINNKVYIGESLDINRRWQEHLDDLNNNTHHSYKLQDDWNKYSENDFEFTIITILADDIPKYVDNFILMLYEDTYIKQYSSISKGYNVENTLEKSLNGDKNNFSKKDSIMLNRVKQKIANGQITNSNSIISFEREKEYFSIIPNNLFYTNDDEVSLYKQCNNYKIIFVLDYLYTNTNRLGVVKFTIKDIIVSYKYNPSSRTDGLNKQIRTILSFLKEKGIIDCEVDIAKIGLSDFTVCRYNGINLDENGNMTKFTTISSDNMNKILSYSKGNVKKEQLLYHFGYLCSRMYVQSKEIKGTYKRQSGVCHATYDRISYDTGSSSSTIKKYNDILVELGLIKIGNLGLCYIGEKKSLKESCNFYILVDKSDMGVEDDKNTTWYWSLKESMDSYKKEMKNEGYVFIDTREYKNNNRKINGYISRITQLEKEDKATKKQIKKRDKLLNEKEDSKQYKSVDKDK